MDAIKTLGRQGDILFRRVGRGTTDLERAPKDRRGIVLAEGDSTAHYHVASGWGLKLFAGGILAAPRGATVRVEGGGTGDVPRHASITLAPGTWEVRIQHAWSADDERAHAVRD